MRRRTYAGSFKYVRFHEMTLLLRVRFQCRSHMHYCVGHHAGEFATQRVEKEHPGPGLWVNGVGYIAFACLAPQASQLKDVCEQAPFGRGEDTIVDTTMRNALQLGPDKFELKNPGRYGP